LVKQTQACDTHRKLARLGFEKLTRGTENIAKIIMLEGIVRFLARIAVADKSWMRPLIS